MNEEIRRKIQRRRRQILVHSYIYYELNDSVIDDALWSKWALELEQLQKEYPEESANAKYYNDFKDFDHSTGAGLNYFKQEIMTDAYFVIRYRDYNGKDPNYYTND